MCELYRDATQTVFGEGPRKADIVLVGEQPGDIEDQQGHPFVGPAGRLLDKVLDEAGLDRAAVYLTNAVKHFRWKPATRGKRRLHQRPGATHINACRPWLAAELAAVRPRVVVALGAVAGQSLFGSSFWLASRRRLDRRGFLRVAAWSWPVPWAAAALGWLASEAGRGPWLVDGLLPVAGTSAAGSETVVAAIAYTAIAGLFVAGAVLTARLVRLGPDGAKIWPVDSDQARKY